jgi:hypothetical protein
MAILHDRLRHGGVEVPVPPLHLYQCSPPLADFPGLVFSLQHLYTCQQSELCFAMTDLQESHKISLARQEEVGGDNSRMVALAATATVGGVEGSNKEHEESNQGS